MLYLNDFIFSEKIAERQKNNLFYTDKSGKIELENKRGF